MRQLALFSLLLMLVSCSRAPGTVGAGGGTGDPGVRTTSNNSTAIEREIKRNEEIEAGIEKRADELDNAIDFDSADEKDMDEDLDVVTPPSEREVEREQAIDDLLKEIESESRSESQF